MKLNRIIMLIILLLTLGACTAPPEEPAPSTSDTEKQLPNSPSSFSSAKKILYEKIHTGHQQTFYCGCKFTKTRKVYLGSCDVEPRKNEKRAKQLEAEHVFPASHFGQHRQCWREKLCKDNYGKPYGGRRCCERIDPVFETAHNDLHNLQPAVGEINGDRSNFRYAMLEGEPRNYGQCDFEVNFKEDRAEPPEAVRGDIARIYFYMRDTYDIRLSDQQTRLFEAWNKTDPVDDWERERNRRIKAIQGIGNHHIEDD